MTTKQWISRLLTVGVLLVAPGVQAADTPQYVAMGSSYAAGPGILPMAPGSPVRCARSSADYAHVLAQLRRLSLVDVSCSGATTVDVVHGGQFSLPAQLDAVTGQTQLVTVTIGGNDVFFMANLLGLTCQQRASAACTVRSDADVAARFASLADSLRAIVAGVRSRSPGARVVFVNYFAVLPDHGTCERIALSAEQADHMRAVAGQLATITREVAKATGSGFLDVGLLSRGHDACSKNPWLLGARREPGTLIPPFHPTKEAMRAVGTALNAYPELLH
ncbi:MAG TPA: SGNH/GDSL hydrolase family protein [Steroidobacteraceae bacterium]|nr:SGNH/GDSL hydrolase family protein [Steroidobacteraceae bacterium]